MRPPDSQRPRFLEGTDLRHGADVQIMRRLRECARNRRLCLRRDAVGALHTCEPTFKRGAGHGLLRSCLLAPVARDLRRGERRERSGRRREIALVSLSGTALALDGEGTAALRADPRVEHIALVCVQSRGAVLAVEAHSLVFEDPAGTKNERVADVVLKGRARSGRRVAIEVGGPGLAREVE